MSFLHDTDTCSAYLKGNHEVGNRALQYGGRLYVSAITAGELFAWALRAKTPATRLTDILAFLRDVTALEIDQVVARQFGEIRATLLDAGYSGSEMDLLNAATALAHGLTVVTHNTRDYAPVPDLSLTDWLSL